MSTTSSFRALNRDRGYSYSSLPSAEKDRVLESEDKKALMMEDEERDEGRNTVGRAPRIRELELGFEGLDIYPGLQDLAGDSGLRRVLSEEKEERTHKRGAGLGGGEKGKAAEVDYYPGLNELDTESSLKKVLSVEKSVMEENERKRESTASPEFVQIGSPGGSSVGGKAVLISTPSQKRKSGLSLHIVENDDDDGRRGQFSPRPHDQDNESDLVEVPLDARYTQDTHDDGISSVPSRPITPGSLFRDFDGIHCPSDNNSSMPSTASASRPPNPHRNTQRMSMLPAPPGPGMVYYPAPVPAVLNLPPRISKPRRESRHDLGRRSLMPDSRPEKRRESVRASVVLDSAPLQLEKESAVNTLDSILDASAEAPPVAFTDHPLTSAPVLSYSYRNSQMMPSARMSTFNPLAPPPISPAALSADEGEERSASPMPPPLPQDDTILPTTLLAELESRKAQQKLRNRTAATVSPHGMRNTLLELDAVAQVQAAQRKNRRTHLAWEAVPEGKDSSDDEDVPLAILQAGKLGDSSANLNSKRNEGHRKPEIKLGGLLMQKELEDTEPLSKRRTRLLVEKRKSTMTLGLSANQPMHLISGTPQPAALLPDDGEEDETMAQRRERLKREKETKLPEVNLGGGSLGLDLLTKPSDTGDESEEEETLAQRRERLKREKESKEQSSRSAKRQTSTPGIRMINSAGGGPGARPSMAANARQSSYGFPPQQQQTPPTLLQQQQALRLQMSQTQLQMQQMQAAQMGYAQQIRPLSGVPSMGQMNSMGQAMMNGQMGQMNGQPMMNGMGMNGGMGVGMYPQMQMQMPQDIRILAMQQGFVPLDQKQRDMVERWRSSIV